MKICYNERDQKPDTRTYSDKRINDLSARVKKVHKDQTVEVRYMRLMEKIYESMEEGRAEGLAEGQKLKSLEIIINMHNNNFSNNDISKITNNDSTYIEKACEFINEHDTCTAEDLLEYLDKDH